VSKPLTIAFFANSSWYLANFRMALMKFVQSRGFRVLALSPRDEHTDRIQAEGIQWREVDVRRRNYNPLVKSKAIRCVRNLYQSEKVVVAHHFTLEAIIVGTLASRYKGGPAVLQSVTGMGFVFSGKSPARKLLRQFIKPVLRSTLPQGPVIVENKLDYKKVERLMGKKRKHPLVQLPGGGVNIKQFHPEGEILKPRENQKIRFLLAGRLLKDKGAGLFVEAAKIMGHTESEFYLAGMPDYGNPDSYTEKEVESWVEVPGVHWLRNVNDMPALLRSIDILVHPTFYGEGLPKILMEATACAKPMITSSIAACEEIVHEGKNGWLLREKSASKLAKIMHEAVRDPSRILAYGKCSRDYAERYYSEERANEETFALYVPFLP